MIFIQVASEQGATVYLILLSLTLVAIGMGIHIVFQAYRGYRRNESRRMLFLAIGFAFLTIVPFVISLFVAGIGQRVGFASRVYTVYVPIGNRVLEIVGLSAIIYSLYTRK